MAKKIVLIFMVILTLFTAVACKEVVEEPVLPDLTGKSKQEVVNLFAGLGIKGSFEDVVNLDITEGLFISYGDGFTAGQTYEEGSTVVVNFAIFDNLLPDLSGKTSAQIYQALAKLNVFVEVKTLETNDVEPGYFVSYGNDLIAGDIVTDDSDVIVYVAEELIIPELGLIISKYYEGSDQSKMIELYNTTNEDIDLSNFYLVIHKKVAANTIEIKTELSGTLTSNETFIIANPDSNAEILALADMTSSNLVYNGREAISLTYSNGVITDVLGIIGNGLLYANERTLVRHATVDIATSTFDTKEWGTYAVNNFSMFGSHPLDYPESFILEAEYLLLDYFTEPGGTVKVEFDYNNDGDTAYFDPGFQGGDRVRFIGIDTAETGSGSLATDAQQYVSSLLTNATNVYIQRDPASGLKGTYGRHLGLVWADDILVNYMVIKMGYSQNNYSDPDQQLVFNGVSLDQWMKNAELYAKENKLGMWA